MPEGTKAFTNDNIVLFVHGATFPSTPDFDLQFKDYSWADWLVQQGYVVYIFDKRNYSLASPGKPHEIPPARKPPHSDPHLGVYELSRMVERSRSKYHKAEAALVAGSVR